MATARKKPAPRASDEKTKQAPRPRGRPPGRGKPIGKTRDSYNLSLDLDLIAWLKEHSEGPAAVANRALRREKEREEKAARKNSSQG